MRRQNNKLFLAVVSFALVTGVLFSCHKENEQTEYISKELKEYFGFDTGSYWVYYDSLSNTYDYLYMVMNHPYISFSNEEYKKNKEISEILMVDTSAVSKTIKVYFDLSARFHSSLRITDLNGDTTIGQWTLSDKMPFDIESHTYIEDDTNKYRCEYSGDFLLGSQTYHRVYHIFNGSKTKFIDVYLNSSEGIIKLISTTEYFKKNLNLQTHKVVYKNF